MTVLYPNDKWRAIALERAKVYVDLRDRFLATQEKLLQLRSSWKDTLSPEALVEQQMAFTQMDYNVTQLREKMEKARSEFHSAVKESLGILS